MSIIENISKQLVFNNSEVCPGGEETIKKIFERTPIQLPADYYEFLSCISGTGNLKSKATMKILGTYLYVFGQQTGH